MARTAVAYLLPQDQPPERALPHGVAVRHTVIERDAGRRSGLVQALELIAGGQADTLLVARLGAPVGSAGELVRLLDWLDRHQASLVALDVGLDTAGRAGQRTLAVLREVHRWSREPELPRRRPGRPGLNDAAPELARRIAALRDQGLSLQAVADALNAEGIPTPRGGARWRASSVQAALGYRRPHPPVPRAPRASRPPRGGRPPGRRGRAAPPGPRP